MTSQDDLGMLWYGVSGVSFNPTDPSEVMLNAGTTAPLLSDHPRPLLAPPSQAITSHSQISMQYGDPNSLPQNQMLYDPNTGDFVSTNDYIYETYEGYEEDNSGSQSLEAMRPHHEMLNQQVVNVLCQGDNDNQNQNKTKKPKVHQHPSLKLKTPIAYQKDTDLDAIPIQKEGMAVCKKCGAIGVKHAFYGKERQFCSLACARPPQMLTKMPLEILNKCHQMKMSPGHESPEMPEDPLKFSSEHTNQKMNIVTPDSDISQVECLMPEEDSKNMCNGFSNFELVDQENRYKSVNVFENIADNGVKQSTKLSQLARPQSTDPSYPEGSILNSENSNDSRMSNEIPDTFDWSISYLDKDEMSAAPVNSFVHAPMSECWEQMSPGMKVEVSCGEESSMKDAFWVATVISIIGYKARLRFEGFVDDSSKDLWVDLCSEEVHPVGWCATQGKPLIPPKSIQYKYSDWKDFLMRRLTGARTMPTNFQTRVVESQKSRFRPGLNLEVVDKNRIAQMRVATVTNIVGKRLHLRYHGASPDDNGFWCHEDSPIIHPVGWSREIGHEIVASQSYHEKCMDVTYDEDDATPDLFILPPQTYAALAKNSQNHFVKGMKVEAIDPLNLVTICVATIMKVLSQNYLMIRIDSYASDNTGSDWFCYHASSPCIFPAGFCEMNEIPLTPPKGYEGQFSWYNYLTKTQSTAATPALFNKVAPEHGFEMGMFLEAADLMDPRLVCVARVKDVKGSLLLIHFDGWENEFDQWVDFSSPDIYPVGWCKMVGYKLEGPREYVLPPTPAKLVATRKVRGRPTSRKASRPFRRRGGYRITDGSDLEDKPALTTMARGRRKRRGSFHNFNVSTPVSVPNVAQIKMDLVKNENSRTSDDHLSSKKRGQKRGPGRPRKMESDPYLFVPEATSGEDSRQEFNSSPRLITEDCLTESHVDRLGGDASDETSSGVASLAGSEMSADAWELDDSTSRNAILDQTSLSTNPLINQHISSNIRIAGVIEKEILPEDTAYREQSMYLCNTPGNVLMEGDEISSCGMEALPPTYVSIENEIRLSDAGSCISSNILPPFSNSTTHANTYVSQSISGSIQSTFPIEQGQFVKEPSSDPSTKVSDATSISTPPPLIPRLGDNGISSKDGPILPKSWTSDDVSTFLKINDCGAYCDRFVNERIDGGKLISLSQNDVMGLTGMKVGPSLKIHDLIQQLLAIVNPAQARYQATLLKRGISFGKT